MASLRSRHWRTGLAITFLTLAAGATAQSCGGGGGLQDTRGPSPCEDVLADQCGADCSGDTSCPDGLYCGTDGTCTADCTPDGGQCLDDEVCTSEGRCNQGGIFGNLDGGGGDGSPMQGDGCVAFDVGFEKQIPTVVLLVDQSGSMNDNFNGQSRWNAVRDSLMAQPNGIVATLEDDVRFGLALYSSQNGNAGGQCPILTEVSISLMNFNQINTIFQAADPIDETPTGESLALVAADLDTFNEPGDKIIVLATDGEPDTCEEPNPQNGQPEAITAAQNAFSDGIRTFIISVGTDVGNAHLQDMANAGVGNPVGGSANAPFWIADNQQGLIDAFRQIISGVRSCVVDLDGRVDEQFASQGTVRIDGRELIFNDPDGWQLNNPEQIELLGDACQTLKEDASTLSIVFPCGVVVPIPA